MGVIPMKDDEGFRKHNQQATEAAAVELREFVADIEAVDAQMQDLQRERKDLFTVVKSRGYDVKALRKVLAERKRDAAELAEEREVMALYQELLL